MTFIHGKEVEPDLRALDRFELETPDAKLVNAESLEKALQRRVRGEVAFDDTHRAMYATDASNYRQMPIGVVFPRDKEDVVAAVDICSRYGAPILARGGGTSLAGQTVNVAVVLAMNRHMNEVLEIDPERRIARVQPGVILDDLRYEAGEHGLTFGPDPATHQWCTLGGMIGNNSCGVHSVMAGKTVDNVEELEILTYNGLRMRVGRTDDEEVAQIMAEGGQRGEIYSRLRDLRDRYGDLVRERYPDIPRRVSGYNLDELLPENGFNVARALVGSECTCALVLEATVRLVPQPNAQALLVLGYPDIYSAADHVPEIMEFEPVGLEAIDNWLIEYMERKELHPTDIHLLPEGEGWLLVEIAGDSEEEAERRAREVMEALERKDNGPHMKLIKEDAEEERVWTIRESGLGATAHVPGMDDTWPGWEDAAVHPDNLGDYLREFRQLMREHEYNGALYGHFGQACVHVRIDFDLRSRNGIDKYLRFVEQAADLVVKYGGSFSGEHGDGQSRAALLEKMYGPELLQAFREFKSIWDPSGRMNPGKIVDPFPPDESLRLGEDYAPWHPETRFQFPDDHGSFARATLRCVGVGKCRREDGGTMCPSYMVTREEKHTTRGRAHLLNEMLRGEVITDGWADDNVKEALDLCLACKGCKGDCPVDVDIATYKAEFLSHYYEDKPRPRHAYLFGLIPWWARLASRVPRLVNFFSQSPLFSDVGKWLAGVAPERQLPPFASQTFKAWFSERGPRNEGYPPVILWADTFNNYFTPAVARAGVEVLEDAGFEVLVPEDRLCCGRPLYEFGMLNLAKRQLRQILDTLRPQIRMGIPIVGLEPSCVSVFRDELPNLLPHDEDAFRLAQQTHTLGEFLAGQVDDGYEPLGLLRKALVHGHCHHKAIMRMHGEADVMEKMGIDSQMLDSGCCGMAGSFGFEKGRKYEVGIAAGERVLLPEVRNANRDTLIIADGFSCREQIRQETDREGLHLAQVLQMALREQAGTPQAGMEPEMWYSDRVSVPSWRKPAAVAGAGLVGVLLLLARRLSGRSEEHNNR